MIEGFKEQGRRNNFSDDQIVLNVIAFVQSLPYTSDSVTTGYDEYPRYPIETLVDGGGDCEDSSILAAALLSEMGYGTVLIGLPNHMALGIKSSEHISDAYYEYDGSRYYYVETTNSGYEFGVIPAEYKGVQADIFSMNPMPSVYVAISSELISYDRNYANFEVRCNITNFGPTTAKNVSAVIFAEDAPYDFNHLLSSEIIRSVGTIQDDDFRQTTGVLKIQRGQTVCFSCIVSGDNFDAVTVQTNIVSID
jgi:Predicted periplasmic protein